MTREELIEAICLSLLEAPGDYAAEKKAIRRSRRIARLGPHNSDYGEARASADMYQKAMNKTAKKKYMRKMKYRGLLGVAWKHQK